MIRRREFITLLGGAAAWPLVARAQRPALPVIGYLDAQPEQSAERRRAFREGLRDNGYVEGESVVTDYRFGGIQMERVPELLDEFVRRRVAVLVVDSGPIAVLAVRASTTIPIVFMVPEDPVKLGLVASLARPGGNLTGINFFTTELVSKRLGLFLHEMVPGAARVGVLVNPAETVIAETTLRELDPAARAMGLQIQIHKASTSGEINEAFAAIGRDHPDALFVGSGPFYGSRRVQLANLASRYAIPAIYANRLVAEAGGLMSYGVDPVDRYRQGGVYAGLILKGAKPADLPVVQSTKFELVINLQTAKLLGIDVPPTLLARADEVIE